MQRSPTTEAGVDLLRFTTAGSVDGGKSTLIGRLLYDSRSVFLDRMARLRQTSQRTNGDGGDDEVDLALLTDGLRAEREQRITIDVAYRYFSTPRRRFIIADTPGHVQYTRNMVTGASSADLSLIIIDAREGLVTQSKRHAFITSLLGIPHVIVVVNKMDLVEWSEERFEEICESFRAFAGKLTLGTITFIPVSALLGDNVVEASPRTPWYRGAPLLDTLETAHIGGRHNAIDFRFPVQCVIRPNQDFRGFAGSVASGSVEVGEDIRVLPSGLRTTIHSIETHDGARRRAGPGDAVVLTVTDDLDISRGDMIVRARNLPSVARTMESYLCWMDSTPLNSSGTYLLRHTTREVQARIRKLEYRINMDTLHREPGSTLEMNEIGRVEIETSEPVFYDSYRLNTATGSFILVDPQTHATVAAGMIRGEVRRIEEPRSPAGETESGRPVSPNVTWTAPEVSREERESLNGHTAGVVWFTGMSGVGKSTIGRRVERLLFARGIRTMLLDGDQVRHGLCGDLGFSPEDRSENIRRVGEVAKLFFDQGVVVLCCFISPRRADRERVRSLFPEGRFVEVHLHAPLDVLKERDPKDLYAREETGEVSALPGSQGRYDAPGAAELRIDTAGTEPEAGARKVIEVLERHGISTPARASDA